LNLHEVATHFAREEIFDVSFDPDRYSAVKIKFKPAQDMKQVTVSIFGTGKVIVTGAETLKEIAFSYNIINSHINTNKKIKVEKTETVDEFNEIFGYSFDDMVNFVTRKNWLPWRFTKTNYKINF
jgi:TATA-box binding protein (TBP) (component of TFIID and TFIIIB)